jgi:hypothetical protein
MQFASLLLSLVVTTNVPDAADVPHLRVIRSLAAESALYIQLERRHQVSTTYAVEMRKLTRQRLLSEWQDAKSREVGHFAFLAIKALKADDDHALLEMDSRLTGLLGS